MLTATDNSKLAKNYSSYFYKACKSKRFFIASCIGKPGIISLSTSRFFLPGYGIACAHAPCGSLHHPILHLLLAVLKARTKEKCMNTYRPKFIPKQFTFHTLCQLQKSIKN